MKKVGRPLSSIASAIAAKVIELCDATSEQTEAIADAYQVVVPDGFVPVRTLDLTSNPTASSVGAVLATLIMDLQNRGVNRKAANV